MIGTKINIIDQSAIQEVDEVQIVDSSPVFLAPIFSSKGTEKWFDLKGQNFTKMFGKGNFKKYGQASIQISNLIAAGARIVGQRMVPDDAYLANAIVVAEVVSVSVQKKNAAGQPLYEVPVTLVETTEAEGNTPIMVDTAKTTYSIESVVNAGSLDAIEEHISTLPATKFPICLLTDNGRGVSAKKFFISPERELSKNLNFMFYSIYVIEDGETLEVARFSIVPDLVYGGVNVELTQVAKAGLVQVQAISFPTGIAGLVSEISEITGMTAAELWTLDVLFASTRKGTALPLVSIDTEDGIALNTSIGIPLANGADGVLGAAPAADATYYNGKALAFFNGTVSSNIYNLDNYPIDVILDANYSVPVKNAATELANYRKDLTFFRDFGTNIHSIEDVQLYDVDLIPSEFATDYCQAFEAIDPYSKKQVKVSCIYDISLNIVNHLISRRNHPYAGLGNNATFASCIEGTLNYEPKITPNIDEKSILEDLRVNFASYFNKNLIIESLFTSQKAYTQLSFSNNVLAIQRVLKGLRAAFPAIRYQFISNEEDLQSYTSTINNYLGLYSGDFEELSFEYVSDPVMVANKIFKAAVKFRCKDFAMAELIDAYVLPSALSS